MLMGFSGCFLQGYYDMAAAFTSQDLKVFVHAGQMSSVPEGQKKDTDFRKKSHVPQLPRELIKFSICIWFAW